MRIALDLRACQFSNYATRGIGSYSKKLAAAILEHDHTNEYSIFGYKGMADFLPVKKDGNTAIIEMFRHVPLLVNQRTFQARKSLESAYFNFLLKKRHIDVVLSFLSGDCQVKLDCRKVSTLVRIFYDAIPLLFSQQYLDEQHKAKYISNLQEFENSDAVITISHNSKRDLLRYIHFDENKIKVIYPGINGSNVSEISHAEETLSKHGIHNKFLLYVGGYDYRKNVGSIIEAFARVTKDIIDGFQLVFVGDIGQPEKDKLLALAEKYAIQNRVIFTGFIPDHEVSYLY
ncbi:MAG: glycosyltransferase, partial [Patescibacteria group bacterium]